jgi:dCTP deaminase
VRGPNSTMCGLMSTTGVPSMASRPRTVTTRPSMPSSSHVVTPSRLGRFLPRCEDSDQGPFGIPAWATGAGLDGILRDAVEHVDDVEVGELFQSEQRLGAEAVGQHDRRRLAVPIVVGRRVRVLRTHPIGSTVSAAMPQIVSCVSAGYARRVLLSDRDLRAEIAAGRLGIDPFDDDLVQPSSVDVRLDSLFRVFNNTRYTHIDPAQQQDELTSLVEPAQGEPFVLHPGEFVLGSTLETCTLPEDLAGRLEGKSSLGRLGLLTHSTAGFIDPGFSGHITLELSNVANLPITLWPGMKIGQLCILRLTSPAEHPYGSASVGSKYQGQRGPTPSRSYLNFIRST